MPEFDPHIHHRRSIRLKGFDYSSAGAYYVTIVTRHRECLFGDVTNGKIRLSKVGKIVEWEWLELPKRLSFVTLGAHMVMPNHFHGILFIHENVRATRHGQINSHTGSEPLQALTTNGIDGSPLPLPRGPKPASLGAIIAQFKSRATKRIWKIPEYTETPVWQRNYYEHVIRDDKDLYNKTDYINANPLLWDEDDENPLRVTNL